MPIPQAKISNPSSTQRLSLGLWLATKALERLKNLSGWVAFLTSSAIGFVLPFVAFQEGAIGPGIMLSIVGIVAVALLFGLWRSKAPIWAKLIRSMFLCIPVAGVVFYQLLDPPTQHGDESSPMAGISSYRR